MGAIKCVIWDLDNTIWDGTCLEDATVELRPGIREVLEGLHERGIVQSVASKNEPRAYEFVERFGLKDFFVYPEVNWEPKENNVRAIIERLNIGADAVAFVDDNPFERDSVATMVEGVRVYDADEYRDLLDRSEFQLAYDTPEARLRGRMYVEEAERREIEAQHDGRREDFLRDLEMVADPRPATTDDLSRIQELVTRTNQFNSTGRRYTDEELRGFFAAADHRFYVTGLVDRYGDYGRCGVTLVRHEDDVWHLEIVLLSCRVAGRGLGTVFLAWMTEEAARHGAREVRATYVRTERNRQIGLLYKVLGFERDATASSDEKSVFVRSLDDGTVPRPDWIRIEDELASTPRDGRPTGDQA